MSVISMKQHVERREDQLQVESLKQCLTNLWKSRREKYASVNVPGNAYATPLIVFLYEYMDDLLQSMPYNKDYIDTVDFSLEIETDVHPMQPLIKSPRYAVLQLADHTAVNEPDVKGAVFAQMAQTYSAEIFEAKGSLADMLDVVKTHMSMYPDYLPIYIFIEKALHTLESLGYEFFRKDLLPIQCKSDYTLYAVNGYTLIRIDLMYSSYFQHIESLNAG